MEHSNHEPSKAGLRKQLKDVRRDFMQTAEVIDGFNRNLQQLVQLIQPQVIAGYLPYGNEPDVEAFLSSQIAQQKKVIMPVSEANHNLIWVRWKGEHRKPGIYGFDEASGEHCQLSDADLVIVPALAATASGLRLGKGKGYYDRALAGYKGVTVAIVFDHELLSTLPRESHDQAVDFVVTQSRLISAS